MNEAFLVRPTDSAANQTVALTQPFVFPLKLPLRTDRRLFYEVNFPFKTSVSLLRAVFALRSREHARQFKLESLSPD